MELFDFSIVTFAVIAVCAFATAVLHGATGMAGGIVMAAILSHLIGIKAAIPVMTCALVFSHSSRALLYLRDTDWRVVKTVLLFSLPGIALGAYIFTFLSGQVIAVLMAGLLSLSFPVKLYARHHQLRTSPGALVAASSLWGVLAGNVIGPGFLLAPFLLGTGMNRLTFVGSLATIVLVMNLAKLTVFGATLVLDGNMLVLGVGIGLITIPGNWLGRELLNKMNDRDHQTSIDFMTLLVIANFIYLGLH